MSKIPIKVKKGNALAEQISDDLKVDLRNAPKIDLKQPRSTAGLFLCAFLALIIVGMLIFWLFSVSCTTLFFDLIPEEAVVFSLVDHEALYNQTSPFEWFLKEKNFYGQRAVEKINDYLNRAGLSFKEDVQPLFKKQAAFILLPENSETPFPFLLLFEIKVSLSETERVLDRIKTELKADYDFSSKIYRQIEIAILKPLSSSEAGIPDYYAYAQAEDYFIISNSQSALEKIIDSVIDN